MRRSLARAVVPAVALLVAAPVRAAEVTDVASAVDKDNPFDFNLRAGYEFWSKTAAIKREREGDPGQTTVRALNDLVYRQQRHTMTLRAEVGLFHDLALSVAVPLVLSDSRSLEYDQRRGADCNYTGENVNCINADTSLTTNHEIDGTHPATPDPNDPNFIVPYGGIDATGSPPGAGFGPNGAMVFRGPNRGGGDPLDTIRFGLAWAPLSQRRDDTKPTWVLGVEYRLSVGGIMQFDRARPNASRGVADGLDHFLARTAISHRFRYVDPYFEVWFDYPFVRRDDTLFFQLGPTAKFAAPQVAGGTRFGFEAVPFERPREGHKIAFDVNLRLNARFPGRGYSEIWEMLASSPALKCEDATHNPACGITDGPYVGRPYSGVTAIENYLALGVETAMVAQATRWLRFRASFYYQRDQGHFVTIDDVGVPRTAGTRVGAPEEYNPAFRPVINQVGRRYKVDDIDTLSFSLWAQLML